MARPTNAKRIVRGALKILCKPEYWIKEELATNDEKIPYNVADVEATCFCLEGAFLRSAVNLRILKPEQVDDLSDPIGDADVKWVNITEEIRKILEPFALESHMNRYGDFNYIEFNDAPTTTHNDIINILKKASQ